MNQSLWKCLWTFADVTTEILGKLAADFACQEIVTKAQVEQWKEDLLQAKTNNNFRQCGYMLLEFPPVFVIDTENTEAYHENSLPKM
jgi:hypothetical protein